MSQLGELYQELFAEYKKGKKPSVAQKEFNEIWANSKENYAQKEEFTKWANGFLQDLRRKNQAKKSSNILFYCSNNKKVS